MNKIYPLFFLSILFSSCTVSMVRYVGSKNTPTDKVDVYVEESAIKRKYVIVGKGYMEPNWRGQVNQDKMLKYAIEKAKKNGADAVFFRDIFIPTPGTNINTYSRTDSVGRSSITNSGTTIGPAYGYFHKEMLFLKYE